MQTLTNKSRETLYETVSEAVTKARIKIEKLVIEDTFVKEQIDKIMFNLQCYAPQEALNCFTYNKER